MEPKVNYTEKEYRTFMRQMGFRIPRKAGVPPWVVVALSGALCVSLIVSTVRYSDLSEECAELKEKCVQAQNAAEENYNDYKRLKQEYDAILEEYDTIADKYDSLVDDYDTLDESHASLLADYLAAKAEISAAASESHYFPQQTSTYYTPSYSYSSVSCAFPLHLYSNNGKVYLGKCTLEKYDSDSIWYSLELAGDYSSKYGSESIWNKYGDYGSSYSDESAFNDRATKPPIIVDDNGTFIGYLTTNDRIDNGWTIAELRQFVENNGQ